MEQVFLSGIEWFNGNRCWIMSLVLLIVVAGLGREIWLIFKDVLEELE